MRCDALFKVPQAIQFCIHNTAKCTTMKRRFEATERERRWSASDVPREICSLWRGWWVWLEGCFGFVVRAYTRQDEQICRDETDISRTPAQATQEQLQWQRWSCCSIRSLVSAMELQKAAVYYMSAKQTQFPSRPAGLSTLSYQNSRTLITRASY